VTAQQADHAALDRQLGFLQFRLLEADLECLGHVELLARRRVLARMRAGDRHSRHGDNHGVCRGLGDIDVAAAGVREAAPRRRDVPFAVAERDRHRRTRGWVRGQRQRAAQQQSDHEPSFHDCGPPVGCVFIAWENGLPAQNHVGGRGE